MKAVTSTARAPGEGSPRETIPRKTNAIIAIKPGSTSGAKCAAAQSWQCDESATSAWPCAISAVIKTARIKHRSPARTLPVLEVGFMRDAGLLATSIAHNSSILRANLPIRRSF